MARIGIKTYLSTEHVKLLKEICVKYGLTESEVLREAFMEYAKSLNLMKERI